MFWQKISYRFFISLLFASEMKYDFIKQKRATLESQLYPGCIYVCTQVTYI